MTKPCLLVSVPSLLIASIALAGCHAHPPATAPSRATTTSAPVAPMPPPAPPAPPAPVPAAARGLTDQERFARQSLDELNGERPLQDVFFDLDQNALRDEGRRALQADASWLKTWPTTVVRVDGHC